MKDLKNILTSSAMSLNISPGESVYIFDFDDTLMFAEHWTSSTETRDGEIIKTDSQSLKAALKLLEPNYTLREDSTNFRGKEEKLFRVVNKAGIPTGSDELLSIWSKNKLSEANIDLSKKYVDYPAVTTDSSFYSDPNTINLSSVNPRIFNIYNECDGRRVILTARSAVSGMGDSILNKIKESGGKTPDHIFTMPKGSLSGGEYKGAVILGIAKSVGPSGKIIFYDDNPKYISGVKKEIESDSDGIGSVIIHKVDPAKDKQELEVDVQDNSLEKIKNALDREGLLKYSNIVSSIIKNN